MREEPRLLSAASSANGSAVKEEEEEEEEAGLLATFFMVRISPSICHDKDRQKEDWITGVCSAQNIK